MGYKPMILVVDDEKNIREGLRLGLKMEGFDVIIAEDGEDAFSKLKSIGADGVILDLKMPKMSGMEFLKKSMPIFPDIPMIILTGHGGVDDAVEAMKNGAYDFLTKPFPMEKLILVLQRALKEIMRKKRMEELEEIVSEKFRFDNIIGNSPQIKKIIQLVKQVAPTNATVMITGDSGTGKEVVASLLHFNGKRKDGPFIKVHCAALPENLLESELFGHEKGAFTGAIARKKGRFELADGGDIFLDEISEISPSVQVKLLRALQEREFARVGGEETIKVNIRIIAASNRDLKSLVEKGEFREDLFYRLNVVNIFVSPLRDRKEDIPLLINHFLKIFSKRHGKNIAGFSNKALNYLGNYNWPGNVRELQNVIENVIVLSSGKLIQPEDLPFNIRDYREKNRVVIEAGMTMAQIEKRAILMTLDSAGWNKSEASRILKIGRKTLLRKLEGYKLNESREIKETNKTNEINELSDKN